MQDPRGIEGAPPSGAAQGGAGLAALRRRRAANGVEFAVLDRPLKFRPDPAGARGLKEVRDVLQEIRDLFEDVSGLATAGARAARKAAGGNR